MMTNEVDLRLEETYLRRRSLERLTVLIGGVGALGNELVRLLAMLGVGRLILVDPDVVELHNGNRSVLFLLAGIEEATASGLPKVEAAARAVRMIRPDVEVIPYRGLIREIGRGVYEQCDIALSAFDAALPRLQMQLAARAADVPFVDGGIGGLEARDLLRGQVTYLPAGDGPCFGCTVSPSERAALASMLHGTAGSCVADAQRLWDAGSAPTTPMIASIIGAAQVSTALSALLPDAPNPPPGPWETPFDLIAAPAGKAHTRNPLCPFHETISLGEADVVTTETVDTLRVNDLIELARPHVGDEAQLCLSEALAIEATCSACGARETEINRPTSEVSRRCCVCGKTCRFAATDVRSRVFEDDPLAGRTLAELGLPRWDRHLVVGRNGAAVIEVAGDAMGFGLTP